MVVWMRCPFLHLDQGQTVRPRSPSATNHDRPFSSDYHTPHERYFIKHCLGLCRFRSSGMIAEACSPASHGTYHLLTYVVAYPLRGVPW